MNYTLRQYLQLGDKIHQEVDSYSLVLKPEALEEKMEKLRLCIRNIQSVAKRLADISNYVNQIRLLKTNTSDTKFTDVHPTSTDHTTLRLMYPTMYNHNEVYNVCEYQNESDLPYCKLAYIPDKQLYAICINGIVIKGNLCTVRKQYEYSRLCKYGDKCKLLPYCKHYHYYSDYSNTDKDKYVRRNLTPGSWLYSSMMSHKKVKGYLRHVSDVDMLDVDIKMMSESEYESEIQTREAQLMHDILVFLILTQRNLNNKYKQYTKL